MASNSLILLAQWRELDSRKKAKLHGGISSSELSMARSEPQHQPFKTTLKSIYTLLWFAE